MIAESCTVFCGIDDGVRMSTRNIRQDVNSSSLSFPKLSFTLLTFSLEQLQMSKLFPAM